MLNPYTVEFFELYNIALKIAIIAHDGQKDRGGHPYILHPITVSENCITAKAKIVALLHDVIEDSFMTIDDLKKEINDEDIIIAVDLLTKKTQKLNDFDYVNYLYNIKNNKLAREVKISDIRHNMNLSRLSYSPTPNDYKRQNKYKKSLDFLLDITDCYISD